MIRGAEITRRLQDYARMLLPLMIPEATSPISFLRGCGTFVQRVAPEM